MPNLDDFNGAAGTELPTHNSKWIAIPGTPDNLILTDANRARCKSVSNSGNYWDQSIPADSVVKAELYMRSVVSGSIHYIYARGRKTGTVSHAIYARLQILNGTSAQFQLGHVLENSFTTLKATSDLNPYPVAGDVFYMEFRPLGSKGELWVGKNGGSVTKVLELTTENFGITSAGHPGLRIVPNTTSSNTVGGHWEYIDVPYITAPSGLVIPVAVHNMRQQGIL